MIPQYNIDGLGAEYKYTEELEKKIAEFLGVKYCVMTSSGTAALFLASNALFAYNSAPVEVPALTMIATANAVRLSGHKVAFYDTGKNWPAGPSIHVSLNGRSNEIETFGDKLIEDACQSFGSKHGDKYLGTFGIIGCFSFSPQKILTSGQGGCCVTNSAELADKMRRFKNHGRLGGGDIHDYPGFNFKFTDIQAKILLEQMETIDEKVAKRKWIYAKYYDKLKEYMLPHDGTPWMVDIYVEDRDKLAEHLKKEGIGTRPMYPLVPTQVPYHEEGVSRKYPKSHKLSITGLWLPSSPDITEEEIELISNKIIEHERAS